MPTINDLINQTTIFFEYYWSALNGQPPIWSEKWDFDSEIPNNEKQGCYALLRDDFVIYIGVGISKGSGIYKNCGLGYRLKKYWKRNKEQFAKTHYQTREEWNEINSIITIGFDNKHYFLAAALEIYLIDRLKPKKNTLHK